MKRIILPFLVLVPLILTACGGGAEAPATKPTDTTATLEEAAPAVRVFFVSPAEGDTVSSPVKIVMGAEGVEIAPAGTMEEGTGHLHVLIDTDYVPAGEVIPSDEQHHHVGTGALETELTLTPGTHVLRLQLGDGAHIALEGDQYRNEIQITVVE